MKKCNPQALRRLLQASLETVSQDGQNSTSIPFFHIIRNTESRKMTPVVLQSAFCLVLQGTKKIHLGKQVLEYHAGDYLASIIDIPATGQVVDATREKPYVGLMIEFSIDDIASVINEAKISFDSKGSKLNTGAFIGSSDDELLNLFMKLFRLLAEPKDSPFLSQLVKREMIYRLLMGPSGHLLYQKVLFDRKSEGIGRVIEWIKDNYSESFLIEELAKENNMSISSLHHKFKEITMMGPLQYQKQLRLQEARRLLLSGATDVTTTALEVGYESPSQFHREYRRLFGLSPLQDIKTIQRTEKTTSRLKL
ncbi:MAG: HTH-type transcriptional activator RhaS [Syntrophorhabdus sp. PtaU1.Bin153]|nr:MAG: HTH-type transcriptional activator RhaS [Syntrophorhabdus sp. PtaU1.Bin153]